MAELVSACWFDGSLWKNVNVVGTIKRKENAEWGITDFVIKNNNKNNIVPCVIIEVLQ